jgi:hypothetical protein
MKKIIRFVAVAAILVVLSGFSLAQAGSMASARGGRVLDIQYGQATRNQVDNQGGYSRYDRYGYNQSSYDNQPQRSYTGSAVGGAVGAILGVIAGRHSSVGRTVGGFGAAAIGTAIGNDIDQRRYERQREAMREQAERDQYQRQRAEERSNYGAQVIVQMDDGSRFAAFVRNAAAYHRGQKVWVIDNDELLPASS